MKNPGFQCIALTLGIGLLSSCTLPVGSDETGQSQWAATETNGIQLNGIQLNGIQLNGAQLSDMETVLSYIVECALPEGDSVTMYDSAGTPVALNGSLGLAPEWSTGMVTEAGQECVSACLAARSNGLGKSVLVSLEGCGVTRTEQEEDIFSTAEGIFWADLFDSANPSVNACVIDGGGLAGRVCAQSNACGFNVMGDCASVCDQDATTGTYTSCGATGETNLIHTWLNLSHRSTFGHTNAAQLQQEEVHAWGDNSYGQLAADPTSVSSMATPTHLADAGSDNVEVAIHLHGCARKQDGAVWCWGRNDWGQVGDGTQQSVAPQAHPQPVKVLGSAVQMTIGKLHTCAVKTNGQVRCWGRNSRGQLGIGEPGTSHVTTPTRITGLGGDVLRLSTGAAGANHTCAIKVDGSLVCWGDNQYGQLGIGSYDDQFAPVAVASDESGAAFTGITDLCASKTLTCARKDDGTGWCWGSAAVNNPTYHASEPRQYAIGAGLEVAPGGLTCGSDWACFAATDGSVWCAGDNSHGQLGYATAGNASAQMQQVPGVSAASFVNAGKTHTCATRVDDAMVCWGTDPGAAAGLPNMFTPQLTQAAQEVQAAGS